MADSLLGTETFSRALFRAPFVGRSSGHPFSDRHLYRSTIDGVSSIDDYSTRAASLSGESTDQFFTLNRPRTLRTASESDSESSSYSWKLRRRRWRYFYLTSGIIAIILVILTSVAIVIGLQGTDIATQQTTSNTVKFDGKMGLSNVTYESALEQKDSTAFKALSDQLCKDGLKKALDTSDELTQTMATCSVNSFSRAADGSVVADFSITLNDASLANTKSSLAAELVEQVLQTALSRSQTVSGYNEFLREKTSTEDVASLQVQSQIQEGSGDLG